MNDQALGSAARAQHWLPRPGRHRLSLIDRQGRTLDAVGFEVRALRGAQSKQR